jgi:hypothetical protein
MPTVKDYVERVEGICGAETDVIVMVKAEKLEAATASVLKRCVVKKSVLGVRYELEFEGLTFRFFSSGRLVFRGVKNRKELNRILAALLLA